MVFATSAVLIGQDTMLALADSAPRQQEPASRPVGSWLDGTVGSASCFPRQCAEEILTEPTLDEEPGTPSRRRNNSWGND